MCSINEKNKDGFMKKDGPGIWFSFHTMSLAVTTRESAWFLVYFIKFSVRRLKCVVCRQHGITYLRKNPPELSMRNLFAWTVDFHNEVNLRNKKPKLGYHKAYQIYNNYMRTYDCD